MPPLAWKQHYVIAQQAGQVADDRTGRRILRAAELDIGGIEYLEHRGERVFYDINANSNLRPAIAQEYGFDPFERVADWLVAQAAIPASR